MTIELPQSAYFLPPRSGENNGVDFLGIRQVNLDMMADLIPSTNNATPYIRPFSVLCWIHWKFHCLCADAGVHKPTRALLEGYRERIETLFAWGARLDDYPNIPGKQAEPPVARGGRLPLTFADWGRVQTSTSLMAALWYGPASKTDTGLGLLEPRGNMFFRATAEGAALAKALDARLRLDKERYERLLSTLDPVEATEVDALALWKRWSPDRQIRPEMDAFAPTLFSESRVGDYASLLGRRSSTLALSRLFLAHRGAVASSDEIRAGMFLAADGGNGAFPIPELLAPAHRKWVVLQMRQLQRLALETLLSWCESRVLGGDQDTAQLAAVAVDSWVRHAPLARDGAHFGALSSGIARRFSTFDSFMAECRRRDDWSPFRLMGEIQRARRESDDALPSLCIFSLSLCAVFADCLPPRTDEMRAGGAVRLSMRHMADRLKALADLPFAEAVRFCIEMFVISQHFATAVNRFDGINSRLRLTIEENGLSPLVNEAWAPTVAADRLFILLALAADCGLLKYEDQNLYSWPAN